jgi:hypothetical protein
MKLHKSWGVALIVFGMVLLTSAIGKLIHLDDYLAARVDQHIERGMERIGENMERFDHEMDQFGRSMEALAKGFGDGHLLTESGELKIALDNLKTIRLENRVGEIKVTADPNAKEATLKYIKKLNSNEPQQEAENRLHHPQVLVEDVKEDMKRVWTDQYDDGFWLKQFRVDYELIVPPTLAIEIQSSVGDITTIGLQSDLKIDADVSKIDVSGFKGTLHVKNNTGAISIQNGQEIKELEVNSNVGAVTVALAEKANVKVEAKTNVGALDSEFELNERRTGPSKSAQGQIGDGSGGQVTINTNTGAIEIKKQK